MRFVDSAETFIIETVRETMIDALGAMSDSRQTQIDISGESGGRRAEINTGIRRRRRFTSTVFTLDNTNSVRCIGRNDHR